MQNLIESEKHNKIEPLTHQKSGKAPDLDHGVPWPTLLSQLQATVPFVFKDPAFLAKSSSVYYLNLVRYWDQQLDGLNEDSRTELLRELTPSDLFDGMLSAHYTSVASFSPTDVDIHIRHKFWKAPFHTDEKLKMAKRVLEAFKWETHHVSTREVHLESKITGHQGEWVSVAVPALVFLTSSEINQDLARNLLDLLDDLVDQTASTFYRLLQGPISKELLVASSLIAHCFGDLDRVLDAARLPSEDPLLKKFYKLSHAPEQRTFEKPATWRSLIIAGELNKALLAVENHRHFALRKPRGLRKKPEYLLPMGPFFDDWGKTLGSAFGKSKELSEIEIRDIVDALVSGFQILKGASIGYARALHGLIESFPSGIRGLKDILSAKTGRELQSGTLASLLSVSQERFEISYLKQAEKILNPLKRQWL